MESRVQSIHRLQRSSRNRRLPVSDRDGPKSYLLSGEGYYTPVPDCYDVLGSELDRSGTDRCKFGNLGDVVSDARRLSVCHYGSVATRIVYYTHGPVHSSVDGGRIPESHADCRKRSIGQEGGNRISQSYRSWVESGLPNIFADYLVRFVCAVAPIGPSRAQNPGVQSGRGAATPITSAFGP